MRETGPARMAGSTSHVGDMTSAHERQDQRTEVPPPRHKPWCEAHVSMVGGGITH